MFIKKLIYKIFNSLTNSSNFVFLFDKSLFIFLF